MQAILRHLLSDVIDYAGLFPPAQLDFDQAIRNFAAYRKEPESWMLARFICPAKWLNELDPYINELFSKSEPLRLSILGQGGATSTEFIANVEYDLQQVSEFVNRYQVNIRLEAFEIRLPDDCSDSSSLHQLLREVASRLEPYQLTALPIYYEASPKLDWLTTWSIIINSIARVSDELMGEAGRSGFKIRCGGVEAAAFPSLEKVASGIWLTSRAGIPAKFTAGLHHPLRHYNQELKTEMHGFLNVFLAGIMSTVESIGEMDLREILALQTVDSFNISDTDLKWNGINLTNEDVIAARQRVVTSFGSCSFDEPREDLEAIGLLNHSYETQEQS